MTATASRSSSKTEDHHAVLIAASTPQPQPQQVAMSRRGGAGRSKRRGIGGVGMAAILLPASFAAAACIPLTGSTMCSAFKNSQISTDRLASEL